jgi:hypothetical protein
MLGRRAAHGRQRDRLVEGHEPPAVAHGQRQQIHVGDRVVALDASEVEAFVLAQRDVVGPNA